MRQHRIYIPDDINSGVTVPLNKNTTHYIQTVLRLKHDADIYIFNGNGSEYRARLSLSKKSSFLEVIEHTRTEKNESTQVHLIQSIARGDHMDYAIQKATELGVSVISPIITARTQNHDKKRLEKRYQHWQNIIIHACEQSGRCILPALRAISHYETLISDCNESMKLICQPGTGKIQMQPKPDSIAALVGPEGGLTHIEIEKALEAGFKPVSLGRHVLRTETAATGIMTVIQYLLN